LKYAEMYRHMTSREWWDYGNVEYNRVAADWIVYSQHCINNSNGISDSASTFCPALFSFWYEYISDADPRFLLFDTL